MVDVDALIAQMTLGEKCRMVSGEGPWIIPGCERLGIPDWCVSDGPVGVRGRTMGPGLVVPGPSALAATWDPGLITEIGQALGTECTDRKIDMLLAPTVNLHRSPRGGRHFESYSEDPELSSQVAVAYISGVQSQGIGACVKHFTANDQEFERLTIDVDVDERSLREIYLPPFEAAVKEAGVRAVMGAYNFVNGHHACAQPELLVGVLKQEWGFGGLVVSDWGAVKETVAPAVHGLDLEMPGPGRWWGNGRLQEAVKSGLVDESLIDDKVRRIVGFLDWAGRLGTPTDHDEASVERPEHRAMARRAAAAAMVLVHNNGALLPLAADQTVALIGPGAANTALLGGGSASLAPHRATSVLESLEERLEERLIGHAPGIDMRRKADAVPESWIRDGVSFELYDGFGFDGEPFETLTQPLPFNVWFGDLWPQGCDAMSVRLEFTMTPEHSGQHLFCALGFAHARLYANDELVADNNIEGFSAGLGLHGGHGYLDLEAGQAYRIRLDHVPREGGQWVCIVDVGVELADLGREEGIAEAAALAGQADTAVVRVGSARGERRGHPAHRVGSGHQHRRPEGKRGGADLRGPARGRGAPAPQGAGRVRQAHPRPGGGRHRHYCPPRERSFACWDPQTHRWTVDPGQYRLVVAASAIDPRSVVDIKICQDLSALAATFSFESPQAKFPEYEMSGFGTWWA